jgi:Lon protease-like protein
MQKPASHRESPSAVAGLGLIRASVSNKDGTSNLILQGVARVQLVKTVKYRPYRVHRIQVLEPAVATSDQVNSLTAQVLDLVSERLKRGFQLPIHLVKNVADLKIPGLDGSLSSRALKDAVNQLASLNDPEQLVDLVSCALLPGPLERQAILETIEVETRLQRLIFFLNQELRRKRGKKS